MLTKDLVYSSQWLTIFLSLKHKNTKPLYIFNKENPQNSEPQNGPRRGLDFIALDLINKGLTSNYCSFIWWLSDKNLGRNSICWHTGNPNHKKQKHQSFFSASEHHPCHHCIIWKQKQKAITFYLWVFNTMKRTLLNWCNLVSISK